MIFHDFSKKIDDCDEEGEGSDMAQASRASRVGTRWPHCARDGLLLDDVRGMQEKRQYRGQENGTTPILT